MEGCQAQDLNIALNKVQQFDLKPVKFFQSLCLLRRYHSQSVERARYVAPDHLGLGRLDEGPGVPRCRRRIFTLLIAASEGELHRGYVV